MALLNVDTIQQRVGSMFDLTRGESRSRFLSALTIDIASVINKLNNVYKPIVSSLKDNVTTDGISGNTVYTDPTASANSSSIFYDSGLVRAKTIKETFDGVLSEINNLSQQLTITASTTTDADVAALEASVVTLGLNDSQLAKDSFGTAYTLDNDGAADHVYPLAQHIDALGAFFTNYPGVGPGSYSGTYPTLSFSISLSDLVIDTTFAQSVVTDLTTDLAAIRTFVGMGTASDTPAYSAYGTMTYVTDGDSLEESIARLDIGLNDLNDTVSGASTVVLRGSASSAATSIDLTTDGLTPGSSNVITIPDDKAATVFIQWVFGGLIGGNAEVRGGTAVATIQHKASANTVVVQNADSQLTKGTGAGESDLTYIGTSGGAGASGAGQVDYRLANNAPGVYFKITQLPGGFDGTVRATAFVRLVYVDI